MCRLKSGIYDLIVLVAANSQLDLCYQSVSLPTNSIDLSFLQREARRFVSEALIAQDGSMAFATSSLKNLLEVTDQTGIHHMKSS